MTYTQAPALPEDAADAALAYALWDADNTTRLQENPDEQERVFAKVRSVRGWLRRFGHDVCPCLRSDERSVWLVEWPYDNRLMPLRWWHGIDGFTRDPNKTVRFARRTDAEEFIRQMKLGAKAVEHIWEEGLCKRLR